LERALSRPTASVLACCLALVQLTADGTWARSTGWLRDRAVRHGNIVVALLIGLLPAAGAPVCAKV